MNAQQMNLLITAAALWAAYKFGNDTMRGLAMGAAGYMVANNLPVVANGLQARALTAQAA